MLKETFISLVSKFTTNTGLINDLWLEIEKNYSEEGRFYHTLNHLENLLLQLLEIKELIEDWDMLLFSLYYHDIIYDPQKSDNEEISAELAAIRMKHVGILDGKTEKCRQQILATKTHTYSTDLDTNYFTDADLSVLGQSWETYKNYYQNIRKEYAIYPDTLYNPGRIKVLEHFLAMDRIFKTELFHTRFETQARENLQMELKKITTL